MNRWPYHVPILGYHRVGARKGDHVPTVSAEAFERQLISLARWRVRVVELREIVQALDEERSLPRPSAAITFDDGYEETCRIAWPLLKRFGFPSTVFITPTEIGLPGFLTWDQAAALAQDGCSIGSHTMRHSYVPRISEEHLWEELAGSKRAIEERIGRPVDFLSYPVGGFTLQAQAVAKEAGYLGACTTNRIVAGRWVDRYALRRVKVTERDRYRCIFFAKLSGYYDVFRRLKHPG